jgi:hypothetical protein
MAQEAIASCAADLKKDSFACLMPRQNMYFRPKYVL